jgi:diguanylate cyclase (GGDEF)-like protein
MTRTLLDSKITNEAALNDARETGRWQAVRLHVFALLATVGITTCVWSLGDAGTAFTWLYLIVVVTVAYGFAGRRVVAAHVGLVLACLALPFADPAVASADSVRNLAASAPALVIAALLVTYFRERLEAGKRTYLELSRRDPLTGVGNYRTLYERLEYEIARHQRHGRRFAVMLLDLNRFKQVNDTLGHLEGDRLLCEVGQALVRTVRDEDSVARQGGDEFSVLAPETTWGDVVALAGRIRHELADVSVDGRVLAASIGWAIYPEDGTTSAELMAHADAALRANKHGSADHQPEASASASPATRPGAMVPAGGAGAVGLVR